MVAIEGASTESRERRRRRTLMVLLLFALVAVGVLFAAFILRDGFGGTGSGGGSGSSAGVPKGNPIPHGSDSGGSGLANNDSDSPLTLGGDAGGLLIPGSTSPINVSITNRTSRPVSVGGLATAIVSVTAPRASARYPCSVGDYVVNPFVTNHDLVIPASSTVTLASLGFTEATWPSVTMTLSSTDQRGCSNATVLLSYRTTDSH